MELFNRAFEVLNVAKQVLSTGVVTDVTGLIIEGNGPAVGLGATCQIVQGDLRINAQVVGFKKDRILFMPLAEINGIAPGAKIISNGRGDFVNASYEYLGRVINPLGQAIDGRPLPVASETVPLYREPPSPLTRQRISESFDVGIKVVNSLVRVG